MPRSCLVFLFCPIFCASAFPQDQGQPSPGESFVNKRLSVVSKGLAVALCDTFDDNMFAVKRPVLTIRIENNVATYNRHPMDALFSSCTGTVTEPLRVGEVIQVTDVSEHGHEFRLRILSAPHAIQRGIGAYQHTVYEAGAAELRFKLNDMKDAPTAVRAWLQSTSELPGNTASGIQVPQISEGMTLEQVESILGAPDLKFDANGSTIYRYGKIGVNVSFKDGRVTQINALALSLQATAPSQPTTPAATNPALEGIVANSKVAEGSPAAAAAMANVGHVIIPQEQAELIKNGQASKCAIVTVPPGAEVEIDGNKAGVTPFVIVLLKKGDTPRTLTIKMSGFKTVEKKVVPDGKNIPIGLTLEKQ